MQLVGSIMHSTYELLLPLTKLFLCFQNKSYSTKIVINASLCQGPFFYFIVESVYPFLSILEANTCVNCVHWFLHVYLLHLLYYSMLTNIHEIYMLQVESNCWNLIILCVAWYVANVSIISYVPCYFYYNTWVIYIYFTALFYIFRH